MKVYAVLTLSDGSAVIDCICSSVTLAESRKQVLKEELGDFYVVDVEPLVVDQFSSPTLGEVLREHSAARERAYRLGLYGEVL